MPLLAALEVAGIAVRVLDVGALASGGSVADRLVGALRGEAAGRRIRRAVREHLPSVALALDPWAAMELSVARDQEQPSFPVVGVAPEMVIQSAWQTAEVDRLCVVDDEAAVLAQTLAIAGERIVVTGNIAPRRFVDAATQAKSAMKALHQLAGHVVLVDGALLAGRAADVLTQWSLGGSAEDWQWLFDAGANAETAAALRRAVPSIGLRGKLFGVTHDAPRFYRAADVVVTADEATVRKARACGTRCVVVEEDGPLLGTALWSRRSGTGAPLPLVPAQLASGPEPVLLLDGAAHVASLVAVISGERGEILAERLVRPTVKPVESVVTGVAEGLEDLSGPTRATTPRTSPGASVRDQVRRVGSSVEEELAALKRKMTNR